MKKAIIFANLAGFISFLWNDIYLLQTHGYNIVYGAYCPKNELDDFILELNKKKVEFINIPFSSKKPIDKSNFISYKVIKGFLKQNPSSIIWCHTPIVAAYVRIAAQKYRKYGTKVIYTSHGFAFNGVMSHNKAIIFKFVEKFLSKRTDIIITINNIDYKSALKFKCKNIEKINGVGVDVCKYLNVNINRDSYKLSLGIPLNKIIILSIGELSARKNHQIILKALSILPNKDKYCYVICGREIGGSDIKNNLIELSDKLGINLILLGHRSDIQNIIACSDIGAIPSLREGLGLAGIQSLAGGVPLVGSNVQGICDYLIDGKTGFSFHPLDFNGFANGIIKLSNPEIRKQMKPFCIEKSKNFDISVSSRQMKNIFRKYDI